MSPLEQAQTEIAMAKEALDSKSADIKDNELIPASEKSVGEKKAEEKKLTVWQKIKHGVQHFWDGTKLLGVEIKISYKLALKMAAGYELSRRERRQVCSPQSLGICGLANVWNSSSGRLRILAVWCLSRCSLLSLLVNSSYPLLSNSSRISFLAPTRTRNRRMPNQTNSGRSERTFLSLCGRQ